MLSSSQPSAVVRGVVFKDVLESNGFSVTYYYDFSHGIQRAIDYFKGGKFSIFMIFAFRGVNFIVRFLKRRFLFRKINSFDGVVIIKNIDLIFLDEVRHKYNGQILYDFDDAIWIPLFLGKDVFERIIASVDFVSCDNSYLRSAAELLNKNSFVVNGPAQVELFDRLGFNKVEGSELIIGWIGSPSTIYYLYSIYDVLERVGIEFPNVKLVLAGVGTDVLLRPQFERISVEWIPYYNQLDMVRIVKTFDVGLYPLFNNIQSLGRGSLKATIYMSAKVPSVCANFGENQRIIENGWNAMLASSQEEWFSAISALLVQPELRQSIAKNGYEFVKERYSLDACYDQLSANFLDRL